MKKILSWLLITTLITISAQTVYAFAFFKKKTDFPVKEFRSYLLFQNKWEDLPRVFFGMTRNEVINEIKEPSDEGSYNAFSVNEYGKAGLLYSRVSYSMLKLTGFSFRRFSPVLGNRVSESYARQAGWLIRESPSGKRYMEREINDWAGNTALVVHFLDDDLEIFLEKEEARYLGLLD